MPDVAEELIPFTIRVYDKNFNFKAFIGNPISLTVTPRFNEIGTASFTVETDHHATPALLATGARVVIRLRGDFLMSGKVVRREAQGPAIDGTVTVFIKDDFRMLSQVLGYPLPANAVTAQTSEFGVYTGNAETVVKNMVRDNIVNRLGLPVTIAPDLFRGSAVSAIKTRFNPLFEKLFPAVEQAGIGVTFRQSGTSIICDVYVPPVYPRTLSEDNGIITGWSWSDDDPTATHLVAGGTGDGVARLFREATDTGLRTANNDVIEMFHDARDGDTGTLLQARAQDALKEGVSKSGFSVTLSDSEHFRYGMGGLVVGAQVTVAIGVATRTDILREVTMTWSRDDGLITVPSVGTLTDSTDRNIANFLARLKKGVTELKVNK
jgi:hypothetical protein